MLESLANFVNAAIVSSGLEKYLVYQTGDAMVHPGLPLGWVVSVLFLMLFMIFWMSRKVPRNISDATISLNSIPLFGGISVGRITLSFITRPQLITSLRIISSLIFLLVIASGLFGTAIAERNLATMLTWTLWWSGVVISILFVGSAWCAICPWDAIATWLVRQRLWRRARENSSLNLKVPKYLQNIWPAIILFVVLTWLELGVGITTNPYATALLALFIVVLATVSLAVYERKAFCRYFCPVGRTIGAYAGIAPIALRPINKSICHSCKTRECFHGSENIEPCPTYLLMGSIKQNTYCTSCGACTQSCPKQNINWQLRPLGYEATYVARPHWDESWFILGLLSLTLFHGFTMLPFWQDWMQKLAYLIGDSGQLLISFSIGMFLAMLVPIILYSLSISLLSKISENTEWRRLFSAMAFSILPLAFSFHLAHNLSHLVRESKGFWSVLMNPFGTNTLPLSAQEIHLRHSNAILPNDLVSAMQALLILLGFWIALKILRYRVSQITSDILNYSRWVPLPMILFISSISLLSLWLLMQPMVMRM
ncbi:Nitrogen assimilation regulatory protein [hydrothermal vent metagenome]|uniref:Nitrogen assimilation regulatory protein n=1 Tax=hydrothermal vent metagenome TaxID=652676 RepID=A0A3B1B011_9ZZZZ